ncbi:hypothetical protein VTJ49DRAFT_4348 [Mycothermus thermophilus]|uniref:Uncharacterized protein n=1 Tax=Humicola insolens TaxID=85995 RepID=A0ABR3V5J1_HUMIN
MKGAVLKLDLEGHQHYLPCEHLPPPEIILVDDSLRRAVLTGRRSRRTRLLYHDTYAARR